MCCVHCGAPVTWDEITLSDGDVMRSLHWECTKCGKRYLTFAAGMQKSIPIENFTWGKFMTFYNYWLRVQGNSDDGTTVFTVKDENHNWAPNEEIAEYRRRVAVANYKGPRNCAASTEYMVIASGVYKKDFPSMLQIDGYISDDIDFIKVGGEWVEGKLCPFPGNKVKITIEFLPDE